MQCISPHPYCYTSRWCRTGDLLLQSKGVTLIKQLGWLSIQQMIDFETTKIVHKSLHNEVPEYLQGLLTMVSDKGIRELRNSKPDLSFPLLKTSLGQRAFHSGDPNFGTNKDPRPKNTRSFSAFKKAVMQTLTICSSYIFFYLLIL